MALTRHDHPILKRLDAHQAQGEWDAAVAAIGEAQTAGLARSVYGLPLDFLRRDIEARQQYLANQQAAALLDEAGRALHTGDLNQVHQLYLKAQRTPHIDVEMQNRIQAHIELLETRAPNYARSQSSLVALSDEQTTGLLQTINQKQPNMARFLQLCTVPRWLDASIIDVVRGKDDGRGAELLNRLAPYSFVYEWDSGRYTLSAETRHFYLAKWMDGPDGYHKLNADLAAHFTQRLASNPPRNPVHYQRLVQAQLYHTFLADPEAGVELLVQAFQKAEDEYQLVAARQYIVVLRELEGQIPPEYYAYIEYGEGWFHHIEGNRYAAGLIFAELAQRTDLSPDLAARVRRGLAAVQARDEQWIESLDNYRQALRSFQAQDANDEVAKTMMGLGNTHLNMAIGAGGNPSPFIADQMAPKGLLSIGALLVRLPLIVYLLWKLDYYLWPVPNLLKLGAGMDWAISRLYSDAILWLKRAETRFIQEGNRAGLERTRENLSRLYLTLHHPRAAVEVLKPLLSEIEPGTLAHARAQLGYADAHAQLGKIDEAAILWRELLPLFSALGHKRRVAQIQSRLGYYAIQDGDTEAAVNAFDAAFSVWQELDDPVRATIVLDAMEDATAEVQRLGGEKSEATLQKIARAHTQLPVRTYTSRYLNPRLGLFQRISIYIFAVLFGLMLLVGLEIQPRFDPQTEVLFSAIEMPHTVDALSLVSQIKPDVRATVRPRFSVLVVLIIVIISAYVGLYTLIGLWLLSNTPLSRIQRVQHFRILIDETGLTRVSTNHEYRVAWDSVTQVVFSKRSLCISLIDLLSDILVQSDGVNLEIDGFTRNFTRIEQELKARLNNQAKAVNLSVSFLCSPLGFVFLGSLLLQIIFVLVATNESSKDILLATYAFLHSYSLINLYNLIDLGVALPLLYWLVIQPIRYRLYRRPSLGDLLILLALATISCALAFAPLFLERPSIMPSAAAITLSLAVLFNYWRFFRLTQSQREPEAKRQVVSIRFAMHALILAAAVVILGASAWTLGREALSFHHSVLGDASLIETENRIIVEEREKLNQAKAQLDQSNEELRRAEQELMAAQTAYAIAAADKTPNEKAATDREPDDDAVAGKAPNESTAGADRAEQGESIDFTQLLRDTQQAESIQDNTQQEEQKSPEIQAQSDYQEAEKEYQATLDMAYREVIRHYRASLAYKEDPDIYTRIGAVASKIGDHDQATKAYARALAIHEKGRGDRGLPVNELDIQFYRAGALFAAAADAVDEALKIEFYNQALGTYNEFLQDTRQEESYTKNYRAAHELKVGTLFNLYFLERGSDVQGQRLEDADSTYGALLEHVEGIAPSRFWRAQQWVSGQAPKTVAATRQDMYIGLGWAHYYLGLDADASANRRDILEVATENFSQALNADEPNPSANNGLAWSRIELSALGPGECSGTLPGHEFAADLNEQQLKLALEAFSYITDTADKANANKTNDDNANASTVNGFFPQMRGELHYILSTCGEEHDRAAKLRNAIDDYQLAVQSDHANKQQWLVKLGKLYEEKAMTIDGAPEVTSLHSQAASAYLGAIAADLNYLEAYDALHDLYKRLGRTDDRELEDILKETGLEDTDEALIELARRELDRNAYGLGRAAMARVLARRESNGDATKLLAQIMFAWANRYDSPNRSERYREAIAAATRAAVNGIDDAEVYAILGHSHLALGNNEAAIAALELAQERDTDDPELQFDLGKAYLYMGDVAPAYDQYRAAIKQADMARPFTARQYMLANALGDVLTAPPDSAQVNFLLATMLTDAILADDETEFAAAQEYFHAAEIAVKNQIRGQEENNLRAVSLYFRAIALDPLKQTYWRPMRTALILGLGMGQVESGEATLNIIAEASDANGIAPLLHVAEAELKNNTFGLAAAALEYALTIEPTNEEVYRLLAQTYYRWGRFYRSHQPTLKKRSQQAMDTLTRATAAGIENGDVYLYNSAALFELGDHAGSMTKLQRAIQLEASDANTFWMLGWRAYMAEQYELSVMASGHAAKLPPNDPRQHFNQGLAYVAMGETQAARRSYLAGISAANDPENAVRRTSRLKEGLDDLTKVQADPAQSAQEFIAQLEAELASATP